MFSRFRWRSGLAATVLLAFAAEGCTKQAATMQPSRTAASVRSRRPRPALFPSPPTHELPAATVTALQGVLDKIVVDNASLPQGAPGLTAAVVSDRGVWAGVAGRDGVGTRLRPEMVFPIPSITKTLLRPRLCTWSQLGW